MILKKRPVVVMLCLYVAILVLMLRCSSNEDPEPVDCNTVNIQLSTETSAPSGCDASDGSVTVTATGGTAPYQYAVDNGSFGTNNMIAGLAPGTYTIRVKDSNNCEGSAQVSVTAATSTLAFTTNTDESGCKTEEGSISIVATGGSSSYEYRLNEGAFGSTPDFTGLGAGAHTVTVRDSEGCLTTQSVAVLTGITYQNEIKSILDTNCAVSGCHVSGGAAPMSLQTFAVAKSRAGDIKNAVLSNVMPKGGPPLSQELKDKIACWVDDNAPEN
jgi:hypothetical protein